MSFYVLKKINKMQVAASIYQVSIMTGFNGYQKNHLYAPAMTMAGALSVTPVRPSVHTYVRLSNAVRSLSRILLIRIL